MGHRYKYEEVESGLFDEVSGLIADAVFLGSTSGIPDVTTYKCTIYDEDTDEELAEGVGNSEDDARWAAERNL